MSTFEGKHIFAEPQIARKKKSWLNRYLCKSAKDFWTTAAEWPGVVGLLEDHNRVLKSSFKHGFTRNFSLFYAVASFAGGRLMIGIGTAHCIPENV